MTENHVHHALTAFAEHGDAEALVATDGRRFTFTQVRERVVDTAAALWRHGIRPGMTIGVLVTNPAESYFVQLGAHLIGCRTAWMSHSTPPVFLRTVLEVARADAFVYEVAHVGDLGCELALAAAPLPVLCVGAGGLGPDLTDPPPAGRLPVDPADLPAEPDSLFQTGGTTGTPKLVRHGPRFFRTIPNVSRFYRPPDGRPMRHLLFSATWHAGAQSAALMTWSAGGTVVMNFGFDADVLLDTLARERITSTNLTPPLLYLLLDHPRLADTDLSHLWSVTVSASPASPARLTQAVATFGPALNVVYGMCEMPFITTLPITEAHPDHRHRLASCGTPWGDARVEVRDPAGAVLPAGEIGEIHVASDLVMDGYWGMPELTAETLVGGWLRTGDVGRFDDDGYLYIVDRVKDMILTDVSSTNVYCRPLEDVLAEHPQVRQAAVVGVPDEFLGEAVHAYVVRTPGATVGAEELRQLVVDRLNAQWSPREVEFVDHLPLTEYGKVDKKQLRARYLARTGVTAVRP